MKQTLSALAFVLLITLTACGQKSKSVAPDSSRQEIIDTPDKATGKELKAEASIERPLQIMDSLKKITGRKWIRQNPVLVKSQPSFFSEDNEKMYFVSLLKISGEGVPFTWDGKFTAWDFLLSRDRHPGLKQGSEADEVYKGTKAAWKNNQDGLIWFNEKAYKTVIDYWHLAEVTDCPETVLFPSLFFKKTAEIPDAITNTIEGLALMPFDNTIKISRKPTTIKTESGKAITGNGYDLNNDAISDVFSYYEEIDEFTGYTRLYINVGGLWKCTWAHLDEECV